MQRQTGLIGTTIGGRYELCGLIGEGGMGTVFLAEHVASRRSVALKRLHPESAARVHGVERFQREARAASATGHENVVEVLDLGFDDAGVPYLVMELLEGESLAERLHAGPLPVEEAVEVACQVLSALEAVHEEGIVHRDLKPANVFLSTRGVKLLDFGISKFKGGGPLQDTLTRTGVTMGTPLYMSPEQARGERTLDRRTDIYSTGLILYEAISGARPFRESNYHALLREIIRGEIPRLRAESPLDSRLVQAVHRALSRDTRLRFATARAMENALKPFRSGAMSRPSTRPFPAGRIDPQAQQASGLRAADKQEPYRASNEAGAVPDHTDGVTGTDGANPVVKARLVLALARASNDLRTTLSPLQGTLPIAWVDQDELEKALTWAPQPVLRAAGAGAARDLVQRLPWSNASLTRVLARLPTLHRSFFSGSDLRVADTDLLWTGTPIGAHLGEVMAGFYRTAIALGGNKVELTRHPGGYRVAADA